MRHVCGTFSAEEALAKAGLKPINRDRKAVAKQRKAMAATVGQFLADIAPKVAAALVALLGLEKARRKGGDPEAIAAAGRRDREALDALEMREEWDALISLVEVPLTDMAQDGALSALEQLLATGDDIKVLAGDKATAWAQARAAEMVGMKRNALGELVPNPNAKWRIDDSTRDMLRTTVETALAEGQSADEMAASIMDSTAFSAERAEMIARTEIAKADSAGAMEGYRASGLVAGKTWSTSDDEDVSDECRECEAQGVISLDDTFANGEDTSPGHPNCRCTVLPVLTDELPAGKATKGTAMPKILMTGADSFRLSFPITKTEKTEDGRLMVEGVATSESLDSDGEVIDFDSAKAAFGKWAGNIREQHDSKKAVGKAIEVSADDDTKQIIVKAFISAGAPDTQAKVLDGTLSCFSIGGKVAKRAPTTAKAADGSDVIAQRVFVKRLSELSVVDVGSNPDSGLSIAKAEDSDDDLKKGMYELSDFAGVLRSIGYLVSSAGWEAQSEGDNSPLPKALLDWLATGVAIYKAMAVEETTELLASLSAAVPAPPVVDVIAAAIGGSDDLAKAGKRFSAATKAALKSAHDACKAADTALAALKYDADEEEPDEDDAGKAAQAEDLKKAAAADAEQVGEIAKAAGLTLAEPTAHALAKAALTELITLRKSHAELLAQPAPAKGVRMVVVEKVADRSSQETNEPAPVVKADGAVDDVATLVKAAQARPIRLT